MRHDYAGQTKLVDTWVLGLIKKAESTGKGGNPHIKSAVAKYVVEQRHDLSLDNADNILKETNDASKLDPYESL